LRVWVNDEVIDFGGEADYAPPTLPEKFDVDDLYYEGWTKENDLAAPASIGAKGPITVSSLKVWRDTFHTPHNEGRESSNVSTHLETYYVQPGHYLCLGDNSTQSSDGRTWGTVPERLMLGRAVFVFFPLPRVGFIR
jgi:signal peptidase I